MQNCLIRNLISKNVTEVTLKLSLKIIGDFGK